MAVHTAGWAVKAALFDMLRIAYPTSVGVYPGHPGPVDVADLVALMAVTAEQEPGPMRTGPRSRAEELRLTVVLSAYRGGGVEVADIAAGAAFDLLATLEEALTVDPTLAGTADWAHLESYELAEATDPDILAVGRVVEISAVVHATTRLRP